MKRDLQPWEISFFLFFMLIMLFVSPLKVPLVNAKMCSCAEGTKIFAILFENNLVLRTSQQSLVK